MSADTARIRELEAALEEERLATENWKARCCEVEKRLSHEKECNYESLKSTNEALLNDLERLRRDLIICEAQLDIVYRIFPSADKQCCY